MTKRKSPLYLGSRQPTVADIRRGHRQMLASRKQLASAIGEYCIRFSPLEMEVNFAIGDFLGIEANLNITHINLTLLLTAPIQSATTRLDILQSLVNTCKMSKHARADLNKCIDNIRSLNSYRNRLLHDAWGGYQPADDVWHKVRGQTDKKFRYKGSTFSPKHILQHSTKCSRAEARLRELTARYRNYRARKEGR